MDNERVLDAPPESASVAGKVTDRDAVFRARIQGNLVAGFRLAAVILGSPSEAEDATQDAVERAWRSRRQLRDPERFDAWFQRILVNSCRDRVRRRRSRPLLLTLSAGNQNCPPPSASGNDPFAQTAERDALRRALDRINVDQRVVIAMRFYLDLEIDEIARRLAMPSGTVKSRLHRGLKELRGAWEANR